MACTKTEIFNSKIDWWVYAVILFCIFCCMLGPILTGADYWVGIIMSVLFCIFFGSLIIDTKYAVRGNEFGVRYFYRWNWFPIDKIESITLTTSILASAALSIHRIAVKFSDRKILKSYAPLEISPKDKEKFIAELLKINPNIKVYPKA